MGLKMINGHYCRLVISLAMISLASTIPAFGQTKQIIKKGASASQVRQLLGSPSPDSDIQGNPAGGPAYLYENALADSTQNALIINGATGIKQRVVILFNKDSRVWGWRMDAVIAKVTDKDRACPSGHLVGEQRLKVLGKKIMAKGMVQTSGELFVPFCSAIRETFGGRDDDLTNLFAFLKKTDFAPEVEQCGIYNGLDWAQHEELFRKSTRHYTVHDGFRETSAKDWLREHEFSFDESGDRNVSIWLNNHGCKSSANEAGNRNESTSVGKATVDWVFISSGDFMMGWSGYEPHRVTVPAFEIAKSAVTNRQYGACIKAGACTPAHYVEGKCEVSAGSQEQVDFSTLKGDDQPVVCIDWNQARAYSKWVGGRLLNEAEWEYAARSGGKDRKYPWGDDAASCDLVIFADNSTGAGCGRSSTWSVCSKPKGVTEQGLCDMVGNAGTWVQDQWHDSNYAAAPTDGSAWEAPEPKGFKWIMRLVRGGSWRFDEKYFSGSADLPSFSRATIGLRPARALKH